MLELIENFSKFVFQDKWKPAALMIENKLKAISDLNEDYYMKRMELYLDLRNELLAVALFQNLLKEKTFRENRLEVNRQYEIARQVKRNIESKEDMVKIDYVLEEVLEMLENPDEYTVEDIIAVVKYYQDKNRVFNIFI